MKKLAILIFVLSFAFAACGGDSEEEYTPTEVLQEVEEQQEQLSAFAMYLQASKALEAAESLRMLSIANSSIDLDGFFIEMTMRSYIDQVIHSPTEIDMRMDSVTNVDDEEIPMISYFRGDVLYILGDTHGEGYKFSLSLEEAVQIAGTEILSFNESSVINQEITNLPNGTSLTFTLNQDTMSETVEAMSEALAVILGGFLDDFNMWISDIDAQIILNDNKEIESIDMTMSLDIEELNLSMQSKISVQILQIGGVEINFPDFLEDFLEI